MDTDQSDNPFKPSAAIAPTSGFDSEAGSAETQLILKQTRPWVFAMGIVAIIIGILVLFGGIAMAVVGVVGIASQGGPMEMGMVAGGAVVYLLLGILYLVPGLFLIGYGRRIGDYMSQPSRENLNAALKAQKSFWKFAGMIMLIMIVFYVVAIVGMMVFGMVGAAAQ